MYKGSQGHCLCLAATSVEVSAGTAPTAYPTVMPAKYRANHYSSSNTCAQQGCNPGPHPNRPTPASMLLQTVSCRVAALIRTNDICCAVSLLPVKAELRKGVKVIVMPAILTNWAGCTSHHRLHQSLLPMARQRLMDVATAGRRTAIVRHSWSGTFLRLHRLIWSWLSANQPVIMNT